MALPAGGTGVRGMHMRALWCCGVTIGAGYLVAFFCARHGTGVLRRRACWRDGTCSAAAHAEAVTKMGALALRERSELHLRVLWRDGTTRRSDAR